MTSPRQMVFKDDAPSDTSDGDHTFTELYAHRRALTAVLAAFAALQYDAAWRSKAHHPDDGPMFDGYFIVCILLPTGPVTYHYELTYWDDFAAVPELPHAAKWDGADAPASVDRLLKLAHDLAAHPSAAY